MATVTFVIPGDNRSGGVRVTVIMANLLRERGHKVRIVYPQKPLSLKGWTQRVLLTLKGKGQGQIGWLHLFDGVIERYKNLDELNYSQHEVVIAVGTYMVHDVVRMTKPVIKVRYNHGFPANPNPIHEAAWRGRVLTITVSSTLVPRLRELTEGSVWGVVPNGIDTEEYFPDTRFIRDGIGAAYSTHPNKAPEDIVAILKMANARWPEIPQYVFSAERRPSALAHTNYYCFPSISKARELYNQSIVWFLPSMTEGLPGVALEAMACGCVVVSSDNEGSMEILRHEYNGLVVPRGNREAFLQEAGRILKDEQFRRRIVAAALDTVQRFKWQWAADRMEQFLHEAPQWTHK